MSFYQELLMIPRLGLDVSAAGAVRSLGVHAAYLAMQAVIDADLCSNVVSSGSMPASAQ